MSSRSWGIVGHWLGPLQSAVDSTSSRLCTG